MLDKPLIRLQYSQGVRMIAITKTFGVSRQRINQIVKNYKHTGIGSRKKLYDKVWKDICQGCFNEKSIALHHKDGDNSNEDLSNLIPLGNVCHTKAHILLRQQNKKVKVCVVCGCKIEVLFQVVRGNKCDGCKSFELRHRENPNMKNSIRQYQRLKNCIGCSKPFTSENPHHIKNRCSPCYFRYLDRWHTNQEYRQDQKIRMKKWATENRELKLELGRQSYIKKLLDI